MALALFAPLYSPEGVPVALWRPPATRPTAVVGWDLWRLSFDCLALLGCGVFPLHVCVSVGAGSSLLVL